MRLIGSTSRRFLKSGPCSVAPRDEGLASPGHDPKFRRRLKAACQLVAKSYYGEQGQWLYQAFDDINDNYFRGKLPCPLITLEITPHSHCQAWCAASAFQPPRIAIHPSVFGGTEKPDPWGVDPTWLGKRYAYDTLLHECIHVSVQYLLGGYSGPSSHNNDAWVAEVNRLAPLLGFGGIEAGRQVCKRVPVDGELTKTGKPVTAVRKVDLGNLPFAVVAGFPSTLRVHLATAHSHYAPQ